MSVKEGLEELHGCRVIGRIGSRRVQGNIAKEIERDGGSASEIVYESAWDKHGKVRGDVRGTETMALHT